MGGTSSPPRRTLYSHAACFAPAIISCLGAAFFLNRRSTAVFARPSNASKWRVKSAIQVDGSSVEVATAGQTRLHGSAGSEGFLLHHDELSAPKKTKPCARNGCNLDAGPALTIFHSAHTPSTCLHMHPNPE
jgi:hypothetical protein